MIINSWLILTPLLLQAIFMLFDEFYFHHKRGLPLWEIIGHPLDTLTVIMPYTYALFYVPTESNIYIYIILSLFSCAFIVKDEFIHKDICPRGEMILHALLFVLHPLIFMSIFYLWKFPEISIFNLAISTRTILGLQLALTVVFFLYQVIYWKRFYYAFNKQRNLQ